MAGGATRRRWFGRLAGRRRTPIGSAPESAATVGPPQPSRGRLAPGVAAANALTRAWSLRQGDAASFVLSGSGTWLMLAALARGASGTAHDELQTAIAMTSDDAARQLAGLLEAVRATPGMSAAIGLWTTPEAEVLQSYVEAIGKLRVEAIPEDPSDLDRWVEEETAGVLDSFPVPVTNDTPMAAAMALVAQADWRRPFTGGSGRWRGRGEPIGWLHRRSDDLTEAAILRSGNLEVGRVVCQTDGGFDVHLLTATESTPPTEVLSVGISALEGSAVEILDGPALNEGATAGGLEVATTHGFGPAVVLSLPAFEVTRSWELTDEPELFGLTSAVDDRRGHFERLSDYPLALRSATQVATAGFSATGFRAASVTAALFAPGSARPETLVRTITVDLRNPFGFLVVDRSTGIVLFAGWIDEPNEQETT